MLIEKARRPSPVAAAVPIVPTAATPRSWNRRYPSYLSRTSHPSRTITPPTGNRLLVGLPGQDHESYGLDINHPAEPQAPRGHDAPITPTAKSPSGAVLR